MNLSVRRIRAIVRKELREYRRNGSIVAAMAVLPLIFIVQPLIAVLGIPATDSAPLSNEHVLLYMLGIPALVPIIVAGSAVAGERTQGTLEPALTTPIRREELLLGKALAALVPSLAIAYAVFALFLLVVQAFAHPAIASAVIRGPDLLAQLLLTPPLTLWSIWVGMAASTRSADVRVAQQLGLVASLPTVLVILLVALDVIHPTFGLGLAAAVTLLVLDVLAWRVVSSLFDRERLITERV